MPPFRLFASLVLGAALMLPSAGMASSPRPQSPPINTDISTRSVVETCTGVTGPGQCLYQSLTIQSANDADNLFVCLYRAYYDRGTFPDDYQQVCTDVPVTQFVIDDKRWESLQLLATPFTFSEGLEETVVVEALITATNDGRTFKGTELFRDGGCLDFGHGSGILRGASALVTVDGESHRSGAYLFAYRSVDITRCGKTSPSSVAPRTTFTFGDITVWTCPDVPQGEPCVEYGIRINDSYSEAGKLDICISVYTTIDRRSDPQLEQGCSTVDPTALTLDRLRLSSGELAPTTITVHRVPYGGPIPPGEPTERDLTLSMSFVGEGDLNTHRIMGQTDFGSCVERRTQVGADRQVDARVQVDADAFDSYSGWFSLDEYTFDTTC